MGKVAEIINGHFDIMKMDPEKTKWWRRTDLELWLEASRAGVIDSRYGEIDQFALYLEQMYQQDGKCDACEKLWKKVEIKIREIKDRDGKIIETVYVSHYEPDCFCYPRCFFCNRWMIIEIKNKQGGCMYCGRDGIGCWKITREKKTDDEGKEIGKGKVKACTGILKLQTVKEEHTVYKCTKCENILRKKIIL